MKIAIVSLWAQKLFDESEPAQFGGAELQLHLLANFLATQCGAEVKFITRGQGPLKRFKTDNGVEVWKLPYHKTFAARAALGLWDLYKACLDVGADVYIQRNGGIETGVTAFAAKQKRRPFLFMCSSILDVNRFHEKKRGKFYGFLYMYGLRNATSVVSQTKDQYDLLLSNYQIDSIVLRSAHAIPDEIRPPSQSVLWVGRFDEIKQPELFLDLAESLPNYSFTMVCPLIHPNSNNVPMFKSMQKRASRLKNLAFYPGVSLLETEKLFEQHRVHVNTSTNEGYPNTFVQAFKWGRPVASLHVDPDGILGQHGLGGCVNGDMKQLEQLLIDLIDNDEKWHQLSKNARQFALEQHDIKQIGHTLYQHLETLV